MNVERAATAIAKVDTTGLSAGEVYRRMAQAAIDTTGRPGYGFPVDTADEARAEADSYMSIVTRLVSPWVRAEGGDQ